MKCEIIKDLMPLYIDGLASAESVEELQQHRKNCPECRQYLDEMRGKLSEIPKAEIPRKLDFLKKLKRRHRAILVGSGIFLALIFLLIKVFVIGFPVRLEDVQLQTFSDGENFQLTMQLKNGENKALYFVDSRWDSHEIILRPYWSVRLPFDDASDSCTLGYSLTGEEEMRLTLLFADGEKTFMGDTPLNEEAS